MITGMCDLKIAASAIRGPGRVDLDPAEPYERLRF